MSLDYVAEEACIRILSDQTIPCLVILVVAPTILWFMLRGRQNPPRRILGLMAPALLGVGSLYLLPHLPRGFVIPHPTATQIAFEMEHPVKPYHTPKLLLLIVPLLGLQLLWMGRLAFLALQRNRGGTLRDAMANPSTSRRASVLDLFIVLVACVMPAVTVGTWFLPWEVIRLIPREVRSIEATAILWIVNALLVGWLIQSRGLALKRNYLALRIAVMTLSVLVVTLVGPISVNPELIVALPVAVIKVMVGLAIVVAPGIFWLTVGAVGILWMILVSAWAERSPGGSVGRDEEQQRRNFEEACTYEQIKQQAAYQAHTQQQAVHHQQ